MVSTLAVEWIEMSGMSDEISLTFVSTLAVEWIEIMKIDVTMTEYYCLHPRGGVD